ncbi:MAG TPA: hypothetical protein VJ023_07255 [Pyrinomonadaceae bacterium]|nr:hypothetical protein [Pyrinomonadaceae bacterium]
MVSTKQYNLCFIGFGNVGKALARLLSVKSAELLAQFGIEYRVTGVASRRLGWLYQPSGFEIEELSRLTHHHDALRAHNLSHWLEESKPSAVFETISLNHETGQPAIDYLRGVLLARAHAITANKGAVVFGFDELSQLAASVGRRFYFESTVADSAPVFSLFRETLPASRLRGFSAILNSTCSVIMETMEAGRSFAEGIRIAQDLGITETDPAHDVDGWDATMKVCALTRVLMDVPLKPNEVKRVGIRGLLPGELQAARSEGQPYKLVARAHRSVDGPVSASVSPERIAQNDPLGNVRGTSLAVHFELDTMPGLTITSHRPNLQSTAYGLLADFINAVRGR